MPFDSSPIEPDDPPLFIRTLGGIEIFVAGRIVEFVRRVPLRPLQMLAAVISNGSRSVRLELIADLLWPDAEGFDAHRNATTTLHRLRQILVYRDAIRLSGGRITLNPRLCRVDVWDFQLALVRADSQQALDTLLAEYPGSFLDDEQTTWALAMRRMLEQRIAYAARRVVAQR